MSAPRFVRGLLLAGLTLFVLSIESHNLFAQNYLGPIKKSPGEANLVKVEILVRDSPELGGVQIEQVYFDGESLPLKPRDVDGNRGSTSLQKAPGTYSLKWVVRRDNQAWPRNVTYRQEITISPRDLWVQISVIGDKASVD